MNDEVVGQAAGRGSFLLGDCATDISPPRKARRSLDLSQVRGIREKHFPHPCAREAGEDRESLLSEFGSCRGGGGGAGGERQRWTEIETQ